MHRWCEIYQKESNMQSTSIRALRLGALAASLGAFFLVLAPTWGGGEVKVKEGDKSPEVELAAVGIETVLPGKKDAKTLKLSEFRTKKNVVLWFYPKALTGG